MALFYSASKNFFYDDTIHEEHQVPADAVEITREHHQQIFEAHAKGEIIQPDVKGHPTTKPRVLSPVELVKHQAAQAKHLLKQSDVVVLRCYEESAPVPAEWVSYRKQLRAVIAGELTELPQAPTA